MIRPCQTLFFLFLTLPLLSCSVMLNADLSYIYADGSGNRYILRQADASQRDSIDDARRIELAYEPVTPTQSSSGVYSGGEPWTVALSNEDAAALARLFEDALHEVNAHQENRAMGTGEVSRKTSTNSTRRVLQSGAPIKAKLEAALSKFAPTP